MSPWQNSDSADQTRGPRKEALSRNLTYVSGEHPRQIMSVYVCYAISNLDPFSVADAPSSFNLSMQLCRSDPHGPPVLLLARRTLRMTQHTDETTLGKRSRAGLRGTDHNAATVMRPIFVFCRPPAIF